MRSLGLFLACGATSSLAASLHYTPTGGLDTSGSLPVYELLSDFDYQCLNLAIYQELIELDLFHNGLARYSDQDFEDDGLTAEDQALIEIMADQEVGYATIISNMLGPLLSQVTRFGEAGTYNLLERLNSRAATQLALEATTTEVRQQMVLRHFEGVFPMPDNRAQWQNFPALNISNNPNVSEVTGWAMPAITQNHSACMARKSVGPINSYITATTAGEPKYVAWIMHGNSGQTMQPGGMIYGDHSFPTYPTYNGTLFVVVTDDDPAVTPANISYSNQHVVAGPAAYYAG
ncbi:uncharacterized protein LAESUDRAFT_734493 [Laetiporus sulphureus 93-53]|uniref:Uncharacterized protein n=1 Tax=Laetiporus sulphureus 93-53 TaxID=1314785 RepID=A0A165GQW5_9APHY|nr:uncharacterized protein LAESUDRAFT_734493 [Laetiporus sulphureus 93-53]KZT10681.1 hypothetical protein LAESUDRAFT_734493 [Laetiporus sulphureus 93-53]